MKHWKADYAVICNGEYEEDSFIIEAMNITEAVKLANEILDEAAKELNLEKWSIWNVAIMEDNVF